MKRIKKYKEAAYHATMNLSLLEVRYKTLLRINGINYSV